MNTKIRRIEVGDYQVFVVQKEIKNLHLGVYPPDGRIRVAAPLIMSEDAIRLAVIEKLGWIKRQKLKFELQARESKRQMIEGESHYFLGQRYRLKVNLSDQAPAVSIKGLKSLELNINITASEQERLDLLQTWYRKELKALLTPLIEKWCSRLELNSIKWGIKRMRTKWGSCSPDSRRIWINLELAKKPLRCIEYIVVHELVHFVVRKHDDRFTNQMDRLLPHWRSIRDELNQMPLSGDGIESKSQSRNLP